MPKSVKDTINLSNEKLLESYQVLSNLSQKALPIKVSFAIAKNFKNIQNELSVYDEERKKLINKYAEKDENGKVKSDVNNQIIFKDKISWDKDIAELLAITNDVKIMRINIADLDSKNICITPAELMAMEYMIEE